MKQGRCDDAVTAYRESLKHRPNSVPTHVYLGQALHQCGRLREAIIAWEDGLRLDPQNAEAADALRNASRAEPMPHAAEIPID